MRSTAPFGFRYQYLAGGVNTGNGWATWNPNGSYVSNYIQDSRQNGITPVFTYYQIRQSTPGAGSGSDGDAININVQNVATMGAYYDDLKLFFQRAGASPQTQVVLHVEPDLWGFLEQRAANDDAASVAIQVSSTGRPELSGLPNNLSGFAQAVVRLRDAYAPNVVLGYHISVWGTGNDILYSKPSDATVTDLATRAGNFYVSLRATYDVAFAEFSDRDAAFKQFQYGDGGASWWFPADYDRNLKFIGRFVSIAQKRVVFWQVPVGNTKMRAMNNTYFHYQDNHVEWFLEDPGRGHLDAYLQAGVIAFMYGPGAGGATCYCDAAGDGVTNPAPINGNDRFSLNADDDGGYLRERAGLYYSAGAMPLPGGNGNQPTSTPTPTVTPTSTPTVPRPSATPTQTPTPISEPGNQTVTFDDLSTPERPLNGSYPSGLIDWGTNIWYLSGPWGRFTGNSVSFNGAGPTSASFTLLSPRRLVQLQAYNGGSSASVISLSCDDQQTMQASLAADQLSTIQTAWTGTCSRVSIGSSNGWDTNFKNLVLNGANNSGRPATPTPTPTLTPAADTSQTITFDGASNPNRPLNGQYPRGVIDWGTNVWYLSGPWGRFSGNSISFNGAGPTSARLTFVSRRQLVQVQAYNGGTASTRVSLSCSGLATVQASVAAGQIATIPTGWSGTCTTVTISSTNGWDTNFNNFTIK